MEVNTYKSYREFPQGKECSLFSSSQNYCLLIYFTYIQPFSWDLQVACTEAPPCSIQTESCSASTTLYLKGGKTLTFDIFWAMIPYSLCMIDGKGLWSCCPKHLEGQSFPLRAVAATFQPCSGWNVLGSMFKWHRNTQVRRSCSRHLWISTTSAILGNLLTTPAASILCDSSRPQKAEKMLGQAFGTIESYSRTERKSVLYRSWMLKYMLSPSHKWEMMISSQLQCVTICHQTR